MADYGKLTDEELVAAYQQVNDEKTIDELSIRYENTIRSITRKLYIMGGDEEDLRQAAAVGLWKAALAYKSDSEAKFSTFANTCIRNNVHKEIEKANAQKNEFLNSYISFSAPNDTSLNADGSESNETVGDKISADMDDPAKKFMDEDNCNRLLENIRKELSPDTYKVFSLYLEGYDYITIANKLGKTPKQIDNALQRIRKKVDTIRKS